MSEQKSVIRLLRYTMVGIVSNGVLYLGYIGLTALNALPEVASAVLFVVGVSATYIINRGWSFKSSEAHGWAAPRYAATYLIGLGVQVGALAFTYRVFDAPHQLAQLFAMGCAAGSIFALLNFWVFGRRQHA